MSFSIDRETGRPVSIKDEGLTLTPSASSINFTGAGVSGSAVGNDATENIPGGSAGSGDVVGPASATDSAIVLFDTTTGKLIKDSGVLVTALVPYTGATGGVDLGANTLTAATLVASTVSGPAAGGLDLSADIDLTFTVGAAGNFKFFTNGGTSVAGIFDFTGLNTADKTFTFPNVSGTVVLTDNTVALTNKDLTGVGNTFPTFNQNTTGSAATLTTPRAIYGNNFDGSAALTQIIASTYGGTGNGFTKFSGPTASEKTFTLPDASATLLYSGGALGTPSSGTLTNATGLPAASVLAGTFGTGAYVMDTKLTVPQIINTNNAITASGNAATVPITSKINTVTNNSAATLTITMATASAVDGQLSEVRILDFSAVAQTVTWVNTENSTVNAPTTSNGSTTLPLSVLFQFNGNTSKWRCIASA